MEAESCRIGLRLQVLLMANLSITLRLRCFAASYYPDDVVRLIFFLSVVETEKKGDCRSIWIALKSYRSESWCDSLVYISLFFSLFLFMCMLLVGH